MNRLSLYLLMSLSLIPCYSFAQADGQTPTYRTLIYRDLPIAFTMPVGQEKAITFSEDVQWSMPRELSDVITGEAISGTVYLTSSSEFETTRFRFRGIDSNQHYMFDITATQSGEATSIRVLTSSSAIQSDAQPSQDDNSSIPHSLAPTDNPLGIAEITRHVFQRIYAPDRLLSHSPMLSNKDMKDPPTFKHLFPGNDVSATPFSEWWTPEGLYATALRLVNNGHSLVSLDPRYIRSSSSWVTFSSIPHELLPAGQYGDSIVAVVITREPFLSSARLLH